MSEPIGDLTNRMRDIFRLVVEAYLDRGQPVGSKALAGAVSLSPASIRGVMQELEERGPADPSAHLGRADPDRDRASGCSSTGSCTARCRRRASGRRSRRN